jgi:hypothetical protein
MERRLSYQIEALDRTHVVIETITAHILHHPFAEKHSDVKKKAEQALEILCDLYQTIGQKEN